MFSGKRHLEQRVRMIVAGHLVQCPVSKQQVPREKCKNSLSIRQYFPRMLPQPPVACDSGTSVTDFFGLGCVFFLFNSMKLIYQTDFFGIHTNFWQPDTPVAPRSAAVTVCEGASWLSLPTPSFPRCPLLFCTGAESESKSAFSRPFGILQTPSKLFLFLASLPGWRFILAICSRYGSQFVLWMSLPLSPGPFPSLLLKPEDQSCKEHSGHHGFIVASFQFASSPVLGTGGLAFLMLLSTSQNYLFQDFVPELYWWAQRETYIYKILHSWSFSLLARITDYYYQTPHFSPLFQVSYDNNEQTLACPAGIHWICPAIETNHIPTFHSSVSL